MPRGLVNDLARFVVGADLWAAPAALVLGGVDLSQALVMGFSGTFAVIGAVLVLAAVAVAFTRKVKGSDAGAH